MEVLLVISTQYVSSTQAHLERGEMKSVCYIVGLISSSCASMAGT